MRIFLTGFMGSGKTYAGQRLASHLKSAFIDLDELIEKNEQQSVSWLFENKGEKDFRILESRYLRKTISFDEAVIATGGGTPCFFDNMEWMRENGLVVYLRTSEELLFERLKDQKRYRPLLKHLTDEMLKTFISEKLAERFPFYEKAHIVYEQKTGKEPIVDELSEYLSRFNR